MSLGKKVILLLILFIILIVYTLINFDYNKFDNTNSTKIELQDSIEKLPTQEISNIFDDLKSQIVKNYNKFFNQEDSQKQDNKTEDKIEDKKIKEELKEKQNETKKVKEKEQEDKKLEEKPNTKPKDKPKKLEEEVKKVEEPKVEKISTREIQKNIDNILKEQRIVFQRRSTKITNASYDSVRKIAEILKKYDKLEIEVAGHTDSRGAESLNKRISQDRANSVKQTLKNLGVKNRLNAVGYGEKFPIAIDDANGLSKKNRRVEINITGDNR